MRERHVAGLGGARAQVRRRGSARRCTARARRAAAAPAVRAPTSTRSSSAIPGHFDLPAARRAARGRPVVFNPLVSLADTLVDDRGRFAPRLAARRACCARSTARRFAPPTSSSPTRQANARVLPPSSARGTCEVCFVGAEERVFHAGVAAPEHVHRLFVGKLIPLHGLETILEAARLAPELRVPHRRQRPARAAAAERAAERRAACRGSTYERLPDELHRARLRARDLRHVGQGAARDPEQGRSRRSRAARRVVTADTPAARELLADGESALLVPPGDPDALADGAAPARERRRRSRSGSPPAADRISRARERGDTRRTMARAHRTSSSSGLERRPRAFAAVFGALSMLRHRVVRDRTLRPREHGAGGLVDGARPSAARHRPDRRAGVHGSARTSTRSSSLFAPLWWLWPSPDLLLVVAGGRDRARRAAGVLARAQAPRLRARGLGFALAYLVYPPTTWLALNEFHPVGARDARCCSTRSGTSTRSGSRRSRRSRCLRRVCREDVPLVLAGFGIWYALAHGGADRGRGDRDRGRRVDGDRGRRRSSRTSAPGRRRVLRPLQRGRRLAGGILRRRHPSALLAARVRPRAACATCSSSSCRSPRSALLAPLALAAASRSSRLNLLSATPTQTSIHFHYTAAAIPPLVAAAVLGGARLRGAAACCRSRRSRSSRRSSATTVLGAIPLWRELPGGETLQARAARRDARTTASRRGAAR